MAGPHQPFGLPDADLPHQKYKYVCMEQITLTDYSDLEDIWSLIQVCFVG